MGAIRERKNKKGKVVFYAEVRRKGQTAICKSFLRLTDAKAWIQDTETTIRSGRYVSQIEAQRHTITDAIDRYVLEELSKRPKSYPDQYPKLVWFKSQFGTRLLSELSPAVITEVKGKFLREEIRVGITRHPQTWNRYLSALSCVLQRCVGDWEWMENNPARRVRREREAPGRVRFLSEEERTKLLQICKANRSPNLYPLVVLALSTGMRKSELTNLTWSQVDLSKGVIQLSETKNGERRRIAIRSFALELLREHGKVRHLDNNFVFPGQFTSRTGSPFELRIYWNESIKEAGLTDFRFHDLRHSCASYLAMNGASLLEIAEVLGHKTMQMVKRYSHLAESHTALVVERMNDEIFKALR